MKELFEDLSCALVSCISNDCRVVSWGECKAHEASHEYQVDCIALNSMEKYQIQTPLWWSKEDRSRLFQPTKAFHASGTAYHSLQQPCPTLQCTKSSYVGLPWAHVKCTLQMFASWIRYRTEGKPSNIFKALLQLFRSSMDTCERPEQLIFLCFLLHRQIAILHHAQYRKQSYQIFFGGKQHKM